MAKVELSGKQRLEQSMTRCGVKESEPLRVLIMQALDDETLDGLPDEALEEIVKGMQKAFADGQQLQREIQEELVVELGDGQKF